MIFMIFFEKTEVYIKSDY